MWTHKNRVAFFVTILEVIPCFTVSPFVVGCVNSGNWAGNAVYSFRIQSMRLSNRGLIDGRVAWIARPFLMSAKHLPCKSTSRLKWIKKSPPNIGCLMLATISVRV